MSACNSNTQEAETGGSRVQGQPRLHQETQKQNGRRSPEVWQGCGQSPPFMRHPYEHGIMIPTKQNKKQNKKRRGGGVSCLRSKAKVTNMRLQVPFRTGTLSTPVHPEHMWSHQRWAPHRRPLHSRVKCQRASTVRVGCSLQNRLILCRPPH